VAAIDVRQVRQHQRKELKSPWRDGTTHMRMSPLEFMQRLAALVPQSWRGSIREKVV
jgi:hypothetical protein